MKILGKVALGAVGIGASVALVSGCSSSTTVTTDPTPDVSISVDGGSINAGGELPDYWPSDGPTPDGLNYIGGAKISTGITGTFEGDVPVGEAEAAYNTQLEAAGYTKDAAFEGAGVGGLSSWKKGATTIQVLAANNDGGVGMNVTIIQTGTN